MDYYRTIMGEQEDSFVAEFNQLWKKEIKSHETNYAQAEQLMVGNRLRPIIMAWGYYANTPIPDNRKITQYAICAELIHKASILLDDWIDDDIARHGRKSFHVEYSKEEAVLYAIYLINRSLKIMNNLNGTLTNVLLETIERMAVGGIIEVSQTNEMNADSVILAKKIIDLETTTLIENSFTIGYMVSSDGKLCDEIKSIGSYMGYCFQLLNDLEPFMNVEKNISYKGGHNFDANNKRKNIVIAYLYGACTKVERGTLLGKPNFDKVEGLINKYGIKTFIMDEVSSYTNLIKKGIKDLECSAVDKGYTSEFCLFLHAMFRICYAKLGLIFSNDIFNQWQ